MLYVVLVQLSTKNKTFLSFDYFQLRKIKSRTKRDDKNLHILWFGTIQLGFIEFYVTILHEDHVRQEKAV